MDSKYLLMGALTCAITAGFLMLFLPEPHFAGWSFVTSGTVLSWMAIASASDKK